MLHNRSNFIAFFTFISLYVRREAGSWSHYAGLLVLKQTFKIGGHGCLSSTNLSRTSKNSERPAPLSTVPKSLRRELLTFLMRGSHVKNLLISLTFTQLPSLVGRMVFAKCKGSLGKGKNEVVLIGSVKSYNTRKELRRSQVIEELNNTTPYVDLIVQEFLLIPA